MMLSELNARFGIAGKVAFTEHAGGFEILEVTTKLANATIALQGAQVVVWEPAGERPVTWLSEEAQYITGKSIRGGAPVCWPWFGPHVSEVKFPAHGYARTAPWEVIKTQAQADGRVHLVFRLVECETNRAFWPHSTPLQLHITVGKQLELELVTRNNERSPVTITEALHTYFAVGDVRQLRVLGLDGVEYLDKVGEARRLRQSGQVIFTGETDRIYLNTDGECVIDDLVWKRRIHIKTRGSRSTVIWNPWIDKSIRLGDMGEIGYLGMVCIESANAADNAVTIAPGGEHRLWASYRVEKQAGAVSLS